MINQEEIFQAIQKENWSFLINVLYKNKSDISSDALLTLAARTFIAEFLGKVDSYPITDANVLENLEMLWLLDSGKFYRVDEENRENIVCQIVKRKPGKSIEAYNFAKMYPSASVCEKVIIDYEKSIPKVVEHTQEAVISVTESREVSNVDYTINLFKSRQELEFFYALKRTYDPYQIYPNVAISCLLNWQLIKGFLTSSEKEYYFKGIIDFVVFDQADGFKPIHFFELDSIYHDIEERKAKDVLKDSIFSKAGVKIIRVRKHDKNISQQEFIKLIRELMR